MVPEDRTAKGINGDIVSLLFEVKTYPLPIVLVTLASSATYI